jgi:hypothetical protein
VFQRHMQEGRAGLGEHLVPVAKLAVDPDAPAAAVRHPGGYAERAVDENRPRVADEDPRSHRREAMPGGEQAAGLVEGRADASSVGDSRCRLMPVCERELSRVTFDALLGGPGEMDAVRIVPAPPARRIVMRRNSLRYRSPPRSKWAL